MNRRQKIIVSVIGIFVILLALLGLTYAYFLTRIHGNTNDKSVDITTADLKLTYNDGNGLISETNIAPGAVLSAKTFTVTNEGTVDISSYGVGLVNVINSFEKNEDLVYTLTCTSNIEGKTCDGVEETSFPKLNTYIVKNGISVDETQTYNLTVTYKETGNDQSVDMNKKLSAKVDIFDSANSVIIQGNIIGYEENDYVVINSKEQTSEIVDGKYRLIGIAPDNHNIKIKNKETSTETSSTLNIIKGTKASYNENTVTFNKENNVVNINLTKETTLNIDITDLGNGSTKLKDKIIANSKNEKNGTIYKETPLTSPANEVSYFTYKTNESKESIEEESIYIWSSYQPYYWTYGTGYVVDEKKGTFTLTGVSVCQYNDGTCNNTLVGKYIASTELTKISSNTNTQKTTTNLQNIYKVTEAPPSSGSTITMKAKTVFPVLNETEKELSITTDDYGTSYYFRGDVKDNYLTFNNMCWRIVRVAGDGSIKLILEDQDEVCSRSMDGNWNIGTSNFGYDYKSVVNSEGKTSSYRNIMNYLNPKTNSSQAMSTLFKKFQTTNLNNALGKLKPGNWCLNDKAYSSYNSNRTPLTNSAIQDNYYKNSSFFYDTQVRLVGKDPKEPTLKCRGTIMSKFGDNTTDMYVGTLTADEVVFAGGKYNAHNPNFYLINNYHKNNNKIEWWTLSPDFFSTSGDTAIPIRENGYMFYHTVTGENVTSTTFVARPSISLNSNVDIELGDGTIDNPYKIIED